jgi:hypothetical protein
MGRNLYHAVRTEGAVPEFDRLQHRERRRLTVSRTLADGKSSEPAEWPAPCFFGPARAIVVAVFALLVPILAVSTATLAAETSTLSDKKSLPKEINPSDESSESACNSIKAALHALAVAEHEEALALDLAAEGGSSVIVEARLSSVLDRAQDLRTVLRQVRQSTVARDPMVDQCTRMGFRALVTSEKLSSDVETVLSRSPNSIAEAPALKGGRLAPAPRRGGAGN